MQAEPGRDPFYMSQLPPVPAHQNLSYFLDERGGEEWGQARELELHTHKKSQLNIPTLESANSKNLPKFLPPNSSSSFTSGAFAIVVY